MSRSYLQNIVKDIPFENLPANWQDFNFVKFSKNKTLFDFQQNALKNALKALHLYFKDENANKTALFERYKLNEFKEDFDYDLNKKQDSKAIKYLLDYPEDYPIIDGKISFARFINRMSFWMATGSGKTLVIVKLIEFLGKLIAKQEIPKCEILFLSHREDLFEQFKNHVEEFNSFNDTKINLRNLKEYESIKHQNILPFNKNEITVFYYRSDLISDEQKEKIVDFKNYDNGGKWYILLDEAHKGDREESKRQMFYSILSRKGFLFNFSATFTDPRDFVTCVFNFNLSKFVEEGYSKHIYVSSTDLRVFREGDDFSASKKQKIVLKALLLLTYIKKVSERIRQHDSSLYHNPLLLVLVNSVNTEDSDLELFFEELTKVAKGNIRIDLLEDAKKEILEEFKSENAKFIFEESFCRIDTNEISSLEEGDILRYVFHAQVPSNIDVLKLPRNNQELIFKLKTSDKPFALMKIGDISDWLKNKLRGYEINESFDNESYFKAINSDDSHISILMGSRSFYEGWDSNRPNIILFINIGVGKDAKKFVLQSVGRGVRIEPKKHHRKRLKELFNAKVIEQSLFEKIKNIILPIETLFVFGTKVENLKEIIATLRSEKQDISLGNDFILNPLAKEHTLLIPVYKTSDKHLVEEEEKEIKKYPISKKDFEITSKFYELLGDKIALVMYDCEPRVLKKAKESFSERDRYYRFSEDIPIYKPELILGRIFQYFGIRKKELEKFKELQDEIVHFRRIRLSDGKEYEELRKRIDIIKNKPEEEKKLDELFKKGNRKEYDQRLKLFESASRYEVNNQKIKIKYLANHYYLPVIVSESEKIGYLNHIITVPSEVEFIEQLEEYINKPNNIFAQFDWWMFSKIDETLDEIYIPYYNPKLNTISKFKPDFIFWMQKGNHYLILFVDPKGTEHKDAYIKIDGYSSLFEIENDGKKQCKVFLHNGLTIKVKLLLKTKEGVPKRYREYWFENFEDLKGELETAFTNYVI